MKWIVTPTLLLAALAAPLTVRGQAVSLNRADVNDETIDAIVAWELTLTPRAEPRPALKHSLWPRYRERTPGDSTPYYYRALMMQAALPADVMKEYIDKSENWVANDLDDNTKQEMRAWVKSHTSILYELKLATYRERTDLDLRLKDLQGLDSIMFLLPDAQRSRELARMLQIKARLEIEDGAYDDAIETLRMGYRLGEFVGKTPTLINDLVGVAIDALMTHELTRMIAQPDAPNMYWAIATLPRPLIDLRESLGYESGLPVQIFPFLADAETAERTPEEWRRVMMRAYLKLHELSGDYAGKPGPMSEVAAAALMMKGYPHAKRYLIDRGMPREKVEAMPVGQVLAIYADVTQRYVYDEMFKWTFLPPHQALDRWKETIGRLRDEGQLGPDSINKEVLPFGDMLMPAIEAAWYAPIRLERQLAILRTIEAIRMHAAANGGELPASLDEVSVAVVPADPLFQQPFKYSVEGDSAVLETLPREGVERRHDIYRYVIRIKK
jgi:hypothetical protein